MRSSKSTLMIIVPLLLSIVLVLTSVFIIIDNRYGNKEYQNVDQTGANNDILNGNYVSSDIIDAVEFEPQFGTYVKNVPLSVRSVTLVPGVDFLKEEQSFEKSISQSSLRIFDVWVALLWSWGMGVISPFSSPSIVLRRSSAPRRPRRS